MSKRRNVRERQWERYLNHLLNRGYYLSPPGYDRMFRRRLSRVHPKIQLVLPERRSK